MAKKTNYPAFGGYYLTQEDYDALKAIAVKNGVSLSAVFRHAVRIYLGAYRNTESKNDGQGVIL